MQETEAVKGYLGEIGKMQAAIGALKLKISEIDSELYGIKAIRYDTVRVQSSPENMLEAREARKDELCRKLRKTLREYEAACDRIVGEIEGVDNRMHSELLMLRYVSGFGWKRIAEEMNISEDYARHLHGRALAAFGKKYRNRIKN